MRVANLRGGIRARKAQAQPTEHTTANPQWAMSLQGL